MRIVVFGSTGMLGKAVVQAAEAAGHEIWPLERKVVNLHDPDSIWLAREIMWEADIAINCAGIIPLRNASDVDMIGVNALGPHFLAGASQEACIRLVHVSTDCVFSGLDNLTPRFSVRSQPDPIDLYGRTKLVGEMIDGAAVVRTSFIGPDHGLLAWLRGQRGEVEGWLGARWTGSSVYAVARELVKIAESGETGLMHLATERIWTKCQVLELLVRELDLPVKVNRVTQPMINRALEPTHILPDLNECIGELVEVCRT